MVARKIFEELKKLDALNKALKNQQQSSKWFIDILNLSKFDNIRYKTHIGEDIIAQARNVLKEHSKIIELIQDEKGIIKGNLRLGIIPTVAPYLIPRFLVKFLNKYPEVNLVVNELTTEQIIYQR